MSASAASRELTHPSAYARERLRIRAEQADNVTAAYIAGDAQEMLEVTLLPFASLGWSVLADRRATPGNLDALVVGPPGVAVLEIKNWPELTTVQPARITNGSDSKNAEAAKLASKVRQVCEGLSEFGDRLPVLGVMALAGPFDRHLAQRRLNGLAVIGLEGIYDFLEHAPPQVDAEQVARMHDVLDTAFPKINRRGATERSNPAQ